MRMVRRLVLLMVAVALTGCSGSSTDEDSGIEQKFLFEVEYVNYAFVLTWKGVYVDGDGDVWSFQLDSAWTHTGQASFTEQELLEKYDIGRSRIGHVDRDRLREEYARIGAAASGEVSDPVLRCVDSGIAAFRAFTLDSTGRFTPVLLQQEGDFVRENRSTAAHELYTWLKTVAPGFGVAGCEP